MSTPFPVQFPLINPNEPEAMLAAVHVQAGQPVKRGDVLCTLETTKSTADLLAEVDGYVAGLQHATGDSVSAGEVFCYLAEEPDWIPPEPDQASPQSEITMPPGLRITQPALSLAKEKGLDLGKLPVGPLVTESMLRPLVEHANQPGYLPPQGPFDPTAILVYGGGGHGKSLVDLLRALGSYRIAGIVDDSLEPGTRIMGLPVLGGSAALAGLAEKGVRLAVNAVGGIGNINVRIQVFQKLAQAGFACPAVVHPSAWVEPSANLAAGVQVFPHAYVGSEAQLGYGVIVNSGAVVSHDCRVGDYANISPGAILAGEVQVGPAALVGMGATINLKASIGAGARIGNGATVKSDVPEKGVVRAGAVWPQ
jgi:sugar O-acyltransferase (sialic acid O-acetyltransferase NeuD family)